jgi:hypothetical protein
LLRFPVRGTIGATGNYGGRNPVLEIIKRYLQAWNETDAAVRRSLVESLWTADGSYTDPLADVRGGPAGAGPVVIGFDVIVLDGDDRIASGHGFLDKVPAAA